VVGQDFHRYVVAPDPSYHLTLMPEGFTLTLTSRRVGATVEM